MQEWYLRLFLSLTGSGFQTRPPPPPTLYTQTLGGGGGCQAPVIAIRCTFKQIKPNKQLVSVQILRWFSLIKTPIHNFGDSVTFSFQNPSKLSLKLQYNAVEAYLSMFLLADKLAKIGASFSLIRLEPAMSSSWSLY